MDDSVSQVDGQFQIRQRPSNASSAPANSVQVLFSATALFQQAQAAIKFDESYLTLPLRRDKAALRLMLKCALMVPQYRRNRRLVQQARPRVGEPISRSVCSFLFCSLIRGLCG